MLTRIIAFLLIFASHPAFVSSNVLLEDCRPINVAANDSSLTAKKAFEIPEVIDLFSSLGVLLEEALDKFGAMPVTVEEQNQFAIGEFEELQRWTNLHLTQMLALEPILPVGDPTHQRYSRNLVWAEKEKGIYVFLHVLFSGKATPKHWHSQNGVNALAFAACLGEGVVETKWEQETIVLDSTTGIYQVQLENAKRYPLKPGILEAIAGDYGAHQISNISDKPLMLFEIYYEPQKLISLDTPTPHIGSKVDHILDIIPTPWLTDDNLYYTAVREKWLIVDFKEGSQGILENATAKTFTIVDGETVFVPKKALSRVIEGATLIYAGPDERFLIL